MWIDICLITVLVFLSILSFNLFGKWIGLYLLRGIQEKPFLSIFIQTLVGSIVIISLYAIFNTSFITIHTITLLLIVGYIIIERKHKLDKLQTTSKLNYSLALYNYFIIALISFLLVIIAIAYPFKGFIEEDVSFYTHIAENMSLTNNENVYHYFGKIIGLDGTSPYHYFELWLGSLLFKLKWFGLSNTIIFRYGCYSILRVIVILGFLALIETIKKINFLFVLLVILITLFQTYYISDNSWAMQTNFWLRPNLIPYYIFLLAFFTFFYYKKYSQGFLFLLMLPIVSVATIPSVFIATGLYLLIVIFIFKHDKVKTVFYFKWLATTLVLALTILIFYHFTSIPNKQVVLPKYQSFQEIVIFTLSIWKAIVGFIITLQVRAYLLILLPCILLFVAIGKDFFAIIRQNIKMILFAVLLTASGIITFQLITFIDNSYQFPYIGYVACYITGVYFVFLLFSKISFIKLSIKNTFCYSLIFIYFIYNLIYIKYDIKSDFIFNKTNLAELSLTRKGYSPNYISQTADYFRNNPEAKGGFILYEQEINEKKAKLLTLTFQVGSYFSYLNNNLNLAPLTDPADLYYNLDSTALFYHKAKSFNDRLPFYKEVSKSSYDSALTKYILKNKINFIIADKLYPKEKLKHLSIKKTIVDSASGHQFIVLNSLSLN